VANELQVARAVADTALSTEGVHSLGTGTFAEVATYGPGEKVLGVIATEESVEVHVVALYPLKSPVPDLVRELREKLISEVGSRRIDVVVEDIALAGDIGGTKGEVAEGESL
jgi:hypothetical protein